MPNLIYSIYIVGRDSVVGIETRYRTDGPGIESQWGARIYAPVQTDPGAHPASYTMGTGSLPGVKQSGCGVDHPPPYSTEVNERANLYIFFLSGPSWPVLGRILPLYIHTQMFLWLPTENKLPLDNLVRAGCTAKK